MSLTERVILGLIASVAVVVLATTGHDGVAHDETGVPARVQGEGGR